LGSRQPDATGVPSTVVDRAVRRLMSRHPVDNSGETVRLWTTICQWHWVTAQCAAR